MSLNNLPYPVNTQKAIDDFNKSQMNRSMGNPIQQNTMGNPIQQVQPGIFNNPRRPTPVEQATLIRSQIAALNEKLLDLPLEAPTQRDLNNSEALQHAYEEMMVIWRLAK